MVTLGGVGEVLFLAPLGKKKSGRGKSQKKRRLWVGGKGKGAAVGGVDDRHINKSAGKG